MWFEIRYFLKGIAKMLGYIAGFIIWIIPMAFMLIYVIITNCGGSCKSVDEYDWSKNWMEFWENTNDEWWKW